MSKLVEAGVLTLHEQNQRNRRFVAQDVIEILNRLPGENGLWREDGGYREAGDWNGSIYMQ